MNWLILVALYILLKGGGSVFRRALLGRENSADPYVTAVAFNLVAGILMWVIVLVNGFKSFSLSDVWVWVLINIVAAIIGDILQFNAFKRISVGDFSLVDSTRAIWTIVGSAIFLSTALSGWQYLGAALILFAVVLVFWPQHSKHPSKNGLLLAAGFSMVFGLSTVNDKFLFTRVDVVSYLAIAFLVQGLVMALIYKKKLPQAKQLLKRSNLIPFIGDVSFFVPSIVILLVAIRLTTNLAVLSALLPLGIITTVILGIVFLKERKHMYLKLAGALLATAGGIMLVTL